MSSPEAGSGSVTLAGVWRMDPRVQDEVVEAITEALRDIVSKLPGFQEAVVLASTNGTEVMVHIEWASVADAQQIETVPEIGRLLRSLRGIARQDRNTYRLAARIEPSRRPV